MVAHATLLWGSRRRMGTAEDLRSRGASIFKCKKRHTAPLYSHLYGFKGLYGQAEWIKRSGGGGNYGSTLTELRLPRLSA
jgi:hypothetical protein